MESPLSNHRLRRGVYLLPSLFTVANLLCGYYALMATFRGGSEDLDNAAKAIGLAILFDTLDGRIARATKTSSEFGKQFDSLADVISFGIAPAFLAYAWGLRGLLGYDGDVARQLYQVGWLVAFGFVICCAWRLARFNIQGMAPDHGARYFVGLPTPAAAAMIAATVHAAKLPLDSLVASSLWLGMVAALAGLMASTIRYYSFKDIAWTRRQPSLVVVAIGLLALGIWMYSEQVLLLMATLYVSSGAVVHLVRMVRHRWASRPAEQ
jgi:CDP-diacylglycerol---serine O-phosphatidyltransferase